MNLKRLFLAMFILGLFTVGQTASAADWQPAGKWEFDASGITRISPSVIRAWGRIVFSKKDTDKFRKEYRDLDYSDYSYTIQLSQIDCEKLMIGGVSSTDYNSRGEVISTENFVTDNFEDYGIKMEITVPGYQSEAFVKKVCGYMKKVSEEQKR